MNRLFCGTGKPDQYGIQRKVQRVNVQAREREYRSD